MRTTNHGRLAVLAILGVTIAAAASPATAQKYPVPVIKHEELKSLKAGFKDLETGMLALKVELQGLKGLKGLKGLGGLSGLSKLGDLSELDEDFSSRPRDAWNAQDPADSLYRLGQRALDRREFDRAAVYFARIHERYPQSTYAADAYYWHAFALYSTNEDGNLRRALALLDQQRTKHPRAGTRSDASALSTRINGVLARRGDASSAEAVVSKVDETVSRSRNPERTSQQGCPSEENDERVEALNALLQMNAERAIPILRRVLERRDPCSVQLRRKAVWLVSQKRSSETEDILLGALREDPDREVREQAVFWLSQVPTDKAADALLDILRSSTDLEIQKKAIFALSQHRSDRGMVALEEIAGRDAAPRELRADAIFWLSQKRRTGSAAFLRDLYTRLRDEELKEKVIFSLSQMKDVGNEEWMLNLATNPNEPTEMRKKALFWAGQGGASIDQLANLYSRMNDREMREQLIFVYSQRRDPRAVDKLIDIARNEPDRELKKKAIFWLGQSRDPRAAQFLEELINRP